mgnify:CR=1 FL=1
MKNVFAYDLYGTTLMSDVPLPGYDVHTISYIGENTIKLSWSVLQNKIIPRGEDFIGSNGYIECYQFSSGKLLCTPDISIVITRNSIEVFAPCERIREALLICVNTGITLCLYLRGFLVLHASAVCCENGLCAFTSNSGAGKSTLCLFLSTANQMHFFGDDIVPVLTENEAVYAYPLNSGNPKAGISITQKIHFGEQTCMGISYAYDNVEFYYNLNPAIKAKSKRKLNCLYILKSDQSKRTYITSYEKDSIPARILAACHSVWALNKRERAMLIIRSRKVAELIDVSELKYERSYEKLPEIGDILLQHLQGIR